MFYNTRGVYTCKPLRFDMAKCLGRCAKPAKSVAFYTETPGHYETYSLSICFRS